MIVLMATGNTPVMDWSIFNGIDAGEHRCRNPEAPHASTLYRTLFLAAAPLFVMTFVINTVAEVIRQRLRERAPGRLMAAPRDPMRRGDSAIWLAGSGLAVCLIMIGGMIALILSNGLFWPKPFAELRLTDGTVLMGEVTNREPIPRPGTPEHQLSVSR